MTGIFSLENNDLSRLTQDQAVTYFRDLLLAEARRIGLPFNKINISQEIFVGDGGIDATILEDQTLTNGTFLFDGFSGFQIKTGTSFNPRQKSKIKNELFGKGRSVHLDYLGANIKNCLERNGCYILVCFGVDLTTDRTKVIGIIKTFFCECGYPDAKVDVWSINNLIGFFSHFPSLILTLKNITSSKFQTFQSWARNEDMKAQFIFGNAQIDLIDQIQKNLRRNDESVHLFVWGEPGIGKTKFVLESLRLDLTDPSKKIGDLSPLVIYYQSPNQFIQDPLYNLLLRDDNPLSVILVIDECDFGSRVEIWNRLKNRGSKIKIISIFTEFDHAGGNTIPIEAPKLDQQQITKIIEQYEIPHDSSSRYAELCDGSPRVAHVIGYNLRNYPDDLLREPDTGIVWNRYITGRDNPVDPIVEKRRMVLQFISIFKRFGIKGPYEPEAKAIWQLIAEANNQITWVEFSSIVKTLQQRKILQGDFVLYITPKALHIKLWIDWMEVYADVFSPEKVAQSVPPKMFEWYLEMFAYSRSSGAATHIIEQLFRPNGIFCDDRILRTKLGANFFFAVAEGNPKIALKYLNRTIGIWDNDQLLKFDTGRREVVFALEKIAVYRDLFFDAARLLLKLGIAENEQYSNNASGIFSELFSLGVGKVATTELPPEDRIPILKEALFSQSRESRSLSLKCFDKALKPPFSHIRSLPYYKGFYQEPNLWFPKTYGELYNAYRAYWNLLLENIDQLDEHDQKIAIEILFKHARGLIRNPNLSTLVTHGLQILSEKPYVTQKQIISSIENILHFELKRLQPEIVDELNKIKNSHVNKDFASQLRRYVGLDLFSDHFNDEGEYGDRTENIRENLAKKVLEDPKILYPELPWLFSPEAENGYQFGYKLGEIDKEFILLQKLMEEFEKISKEPLLNLNDKTPIPINTTFIGGYLKVLFVKDRTRRDLFIDGILERPELVKWIPELIWRSGLTDKSAALILNLAEDGVIHSNQFRLFTVGRDIEDISPKIFTKWIQFLMKVDDEIAPFTALDLFHHYFVFHPAEKNIPGSLSYRVLTQKLFFRESESLVPQMAEYHWSETAQVFIHQYPEKSLSLAKKILINLNPRNSLINNLDSEIQKNLYELTKTNPKEIWKIVKKVISTKKNIQAFEILSWLKGGNSFDGEKKFPIMLIPANDIFEWVDEDVNYRPWLLATFVPKILDLNEGLGPLTRELLIKYGNRDDVKHELIANYSSEGWMGDESLHLKKKKNLLLEIRKKESNQFVVNWIDDYLEIITNEIEQAKMHEERETF